VKEEAAFFVGAVKKGFFSNALDKEKKAEDKKVKGREKKALQTQLNTLWDNYNAQVNTVIREITADNERVTKNAIDAVVKENQAYFKVRKLNATDLSIEDFRKDKILRGMVIQQIQAQNPAHFAEVEQTYRPQIERLEKEVKAFVD
jgi:hypothetical protein